MQKVGTFAESRGLYRKLGFLQKVGMFAEGRVFVESSFFAECMDFCDLGHDR